MLQKFRCFSFVKVIEIEDQKKEWFGIIRGTFSQIHGGADIYNYSIYVFKNDTLVNCKAWIKENQISIINFQDRDLAEEIIECFNLNSPQPPLYKNTFNI